MCITTYDYNNEGGLAEAQTRELNLAKMRKNAFIHVQTWIYIYMISRGREGMSYVWQISADSWVGF